MVKVRHSSIPESNGKPQRISSKKHSSEDKPDDEDFMDSDDFDCEFGEETNDGETIVRTMLSIPEFGFSISIFGIETIDKSFRVYESINGTGDVKPQYGIVLNKDMEKSIRYPRTNIEFWYNSEDLRDQSYDKIVRRLKSAGYKFIDV